MSNLVTIAGYLPLSAQMRADIDSWRNALAEAERLDAIGPVHGPPTPPSITLRRRLGGRAAGKYQPSASSTTRTRIHGEAPVCPSAASKPHRCSSGTPKPSGDAQ